MAQFAFHIATGLTSDRIFTSKYLKYGFLAGAILPDFDFIPMLLIYPFDSELARMFHRSATHTLLIPALLYACAGLIYLFRERRVTAAVLSGIAAGVLTHTVLDIVFWFDRVNLLWPLAFNGVPLITDIWGGLDLPAALKSILGPASEFLYYGILFRWMNRFVQGERGFIAANLGLFERLSYAVFALSIVPAFFLAEKRFAELAYGLASIFFAPLSVLILWKFRAAFFNESEDDADDNTLPVEA